MTLYDKGEKSHFSKFLHWCEDKLWTKREGNITQESIKFYKDKTLSRVNNLLDNRENYDRGFTINGVKCESISSILTLNMFVLYIVFR